MLNKFLIIDFDSTLVKCESLDKLAEIALSEKENKAELVLEIQKITALGMEGKIEFGESLSRRVALFRPTLIDLEKLENFLITNISDSVIKNKNFFSEEKEEIFIISGGFKEFILPISKLLGLEEDHILANEFLWKNGECIGFDNGNPLSQKGGKVKAVRGLNLSGDVIVIGDGFTDYEIKKEGAATEFIAFVANVLRESVVEKADFVAYDFDEVIKHVIVKSDEENGEYL